MNVDTRRLGFSESERLIQLAAAAVSEIAEPESLPLSTCYKAGDLIAGKYRLAQLIGRGGMGVVWEAYSDALDIRVAVKLIHQFTATDEEKKRLLVEAKAAARLVDPGVVRIYDCGLTLNGEPYVVMELLEGEDLATRLDQCGRIQPVEAVRTLLPIVRALGTAHTASIVHRDVKPENVFLTKCPTGTEQPKLLDFGIAKMEVAWGKRLTQAGSTLGSPNYMSPEQARGEEVDGRSDLWGICVVLYEAIAGQLPFDGNSYNAVMHAILSAELQSFLELGVNEPELWDIVAMGLARDRTLRWQSSAELADALGQWLIERGVLHDVTGMSLHASKSGRRTSHVRTLESARPPKLALKRSVSARAIMAQTIGRAPVSVHPFWAQRPRWFLPVMATLGVCVVAIAVWRAQKIHPSEQAALVPVPMPSAQQAIPVPRPIEPVAAAAPTALPIPAVAVAPDAAPTANRLPRKATPSPARVSPKRDTKTKGEPFKSPFD